MEQKELSITEIENRKNEVRAIVEQRVSTAIENGKELRIDILVLNETVAVGFQSRDSIYCTQGKTKTEIMGLYDNSIANILTNPNNVAIQVSLRKTTGQALKNSEWTICTKRVITPTNLIIQQPERPSGESEHEPNQQPQPQVQQPTQQTQIGNLAGDFLKLLGFNAETSLNGFENKELGGLGAIMAVREQNLKNEFRQEREREKYENLLVEKSKLEEELKGVKKELDEERDYTAELEEQIDDLTDQIEQLEKLKPENSLAGVSLVGAGIKIVENLARKHASFVGGLAGMSGDDFKKMLENDDRAAVEQTSTAEQVNDVEVEPVADDPRSKKIAEIDKFMRSLTDQEFDALFTLMGAFYNDHSIIQLTVENLQQ